MYIYKIIIENFRNFQSFSWKPNPSINILFGHNGCGKTNLAEALALVFSTNSYETFFEQSDYYLGNEQNRIKIQVWLDDVNSLQTSLSEYLQHIDNEDNFVMDDAPENTRAVLIYQLESRDNHRMEWGFFQQTQKQLCGQSARKAVNYIHIDADRQPLKEVGLQTRSTFYQMAHDIIGAEIERISQELIQIANEKLEGSPAINTYLGSLLSLGEIDLIEKYRLLLKSPSSTWNYSGYELGTSVGDAKLSFNKQSKGIRSLLLLLLMKKRLEGSGIVFIEELEQNLEPKYQRYIADEYKQLKVGQLFITSHSPDIISHFEYKNISIVTSKTATQLLSQLDPSVLKEIYHMNKKEFISALMASCVLLVEGDSEYESFPIYSYSSGLAFSKYDIELFRMGGKGKVEQYCKAFKHFGKKVIVLLDNDTDVTASINRARDNADEVLLSMDSYEDLIYPYTACFVEKLNEMIEFSVIKNKMADISRFDPTTHKEVDNKKRVLKEYIDREYIDVATMGSYTDLSKYEPLMKYVLHDSFATAYFARSIANYIIEENQIPSFFTRMLQHISPTGQKLKCLDGYSNVYILNR